MLFFFFFFKQKTAYEMRISDWSSDVCSSDLQSSASDIWSDHQRLIDFLELLAGNEPQNIGQHDEGNDKSENQTPRRHMRDDVQQARRLGPRNRNRKIHLVHGEYGNWQEPHFRLTPVH